MIISSHHVVTIRYKLLTSCKMMMKWWCICSCSSHKSGLYDTISISHSKTGFILVLWHQWEEVFWYYYWQTGAKYSLLDCITYVDLIFCKSETTMKWINTSFLHFAICRCIVRWLSCNVLIIVESCIISYAVFSTSITYSHEVLPCECLLHLPKLCWFAINCYNGQVTTEKPWFKFSEPSDTFPGWKSLQVRLSSCLCELKVVKKESVSMMSSPSVFK